MDREYQCYSLGNIGYYFHRFIVQISPFLLVIFVLSFVKKPLEE
jgi:hypothetical protein